MIKLPQALRAYPGADFARALQDELKALGPAALPLARALTPGSHLAQAEIRVSVQRVTATPSAIEARLSVFFTEIAGSCGCGAEPEEADGYCEIQMRLDRTSAEAEFRLIED